MISDKHHVAHYVICKSTLYINYQLSKVNTRYKPKFVSDKDTSYVCNQNKHLLVMDQT